ncbi:hypothetical protein [Chitinivibrio alkaliphilus]|uniref:Uncharacterized protein n=1 Tax=Chitinivibrio alkaliphilus ACht1 TaxID=1313304 RepID=U7D6G2_9BACT|nr:hypothetical protein [Chitinivibrio alkaliphilus]ERP31161.1 hypothetical protein CALK_1960 [Chitinivibrio alkaliphilus ACht1]
MYTPQNIPEMWLQNRLIATFCIAVVVLLTHSAPFSHTHTVPLLSIIGGSFLVALLLRHTLSRTLYKNIEADATNLYIHKTTIPLEDISLTLTYKLFFYRSFESTGQIRHML